MAKGTKIKFSIKDLLIAIPGVIALFAFLIQYLTYQYETIPDPHVYTQIAGFRTLPTKTAKLLANKKDVSWTAENLIKAINDVSNTLFEKELVIFLNASVTALKNKMDEEIDKEITMYADPLQVSLTFINSGRKSFIIENINIFELPSKLDMSLKNKDEKDHFTDITRDVKLLQKPPYLVGPNSQVTIVLEMPSDTKSLLETQVFSAEKWGGGMICNSLYGRYQLKALRPKGLPLLTDFQVEATFKNGGLYKSEVPNESTE